MKAIQVDRFGGPDVLRLRDIERPSPGDGEVLVKVAGAGVNFADLRMRSGTYVSEQHVPFVPGFEVSGVVVEAGPGAESLVLDPSVLRPGTPVIAGHARSGYAEYAIVPGDMVFAAPSSRSIIEGAAIPVNYAVAWMALHGRAAIRPHETVLVHAASGGVGLAAVQLAHAAGAKVVAMASSARKLEFARRAGADVVVDYSGDDAVGAVRSALHSDSPIDVLLDSVGGAVLVRSLSLMADYGRVVGFGQASNRPLTVNLYDSLIPRQIQLIFLARGAITRSRDPKVRGCLTDAMVRVIRLWDAGVVSPLVVRELPLGSADAAHRSLADRMHVGKFVLDVSASD